MRFRKSIKLLPGLRLNISKSGISYSAGIRGASITTGKRGTYINTGIPGTGIYDRKKISGTDSYGNGNTYKSDNIGKVMCTLGSDGSLIFHDENNNIITDPSIIRSVKRSPGFKERLIAGKQEMQKKINKVIEEDNQHIEEFINIHKKCEAVHRKDYFEDDFNAIAPKVYEKKKFNIAEPTIEGARITLNEEAEREINSWKFWTLSSKRKEYVDNKISDYYNAVHNKWLNDKKSFEIMEDDYEKKENDKYQREYIEKRNHASAIITGVKKDIETSIEECICSLNVPVEFSVQSEYDELSGILYLDIDLPEIEDIPSEKKIETLTGKMKTKKRTQVEIRSDYAQSVFGLGIFLTYNIFNISPKIIEVVASGYTQRRNKDGDTTDVYIYSIRFKRDVFESTVLPDVDPEKFCLSFENRCNMTTTHLFKEIKPYEKDNQQETKWVKR